MGLVTDSPANVMECMEGHHAIYPDIKMAGIITLEDVLEKLIQEEIEDEADVIRMSGSRDQLIHAHPSPINPSSAALNNSDKPSRTVSVSGQTATGAASDSGGLQAPGRRRESTGDKMDKVDKIARETRLRVLGSSARKIELNYTGLTGVGSPLSTMGREPLLSNKASPRGKPTLERKLSLTTSVRPNVVISPSGGFKIGSVGSNNGNVAGLKAPLLTSQRSETYSINEDSN